LVLVSSPAAPKPAPSTVGYVTLLDGKAALLRATARYAVSEGLSLQLGDILETADKTFLQIEFVDGGVVALGPGTRLLLLRTSPASATPKQLFLLEGWSKVAAPSDKQAAAIECVTPLLSMTAWKAIAVINASARTAEAFAESAAVRVADLSISGTAEGSRQLKEGEAYTRSAERRGAPSPRPSQQFITEMPREFRDNLVPRLALLKQKDVAARREGEFSYGEVEPWLDSIPAVRALLADHWRDKLADPAFRQAITANLKDHPEWERALHPGQTGDLKDNRKAQ
jgi:hypothetical protein